MSKYQAYAEYKDSGVEWLGIVPEHWAVKKIGYVAFLKSGDAITVEQIESNGGYPVYGGNGLRGYTENFNCDGDYILIGRQGALCGNINYGHGKFWASEHAVVVYPSLHLNFKWLGETLRTMDLNQYNVSAAQPGLAVANITCLKIPFPDLFEQQKIANFLDHETAKIDTLIEQQQQLIKLLKEKRQAVISHAVTKGLNPNAPMRDSGVEWLGEVPAHWEVKRFKYIFKIRKRISGELGYEVLSITQKGIKVKDIESGDGQLSMDYSKYQLVYKGDYAMNHMDLLTGFVDISKYDGVTSPDYRVFTLEEENAIPEYFLAFLQMGYINKLFFPFGQGAAQIGRWRLPTEAFNEFLAPCPPEHEQKQIAEYIIKNLDQMTHLEEKAMTAIKLMKERRAALISAAVTGKIDVRYWQAPDI